MTAPPLASAPQAPRSPWQRLYTAAHAWRRRRAATRACRLPRPVVSVGNLHWGGTGKTPLTAALAAHLRDQGRAVAVLSRGYRGSTRKPLVVSRGDGPLVTAELAGDEPVALALALPGVAVAVGRDRAAAGDLALATLEPPPDLFLLDDGFSHVQLARDLDLLAVPESDPFGGGRLPPSGRLREPLASARYAHALLLTGATASPDGARAVAAALAPFGFVGPGFACPTAIGQPHRAEHGEPLDAGSPVLLVAGIARPERFLAAATASGMRIAGTQLFADHHAYPEPSLRAIRIAFGRSGATMVLTTAKDQVKLGDRLGLPIAVLPVSAAPEADFWAWLDGALRRIAG